jgi:hypothetical protein
MRLRLMLTTSERILRNKQYELSNHLGNVLSVVSDVKLPVDENQDNEVDFWVSDILTAQDYSHLGCCFMRGRFESEITIVQNLKTQTLIGAAL